MSLAAPEVLSVVKRLNAAVTAGSDASISATLQEMIALSYHTRMTFDVLSSSKFGVVINSLRKHSSNAVSAPAKQLFEAWKALAVSSVASNPSNAAGAASISSSSNASNGHASGKTTQTTLPFSAGGTAASVASTSGNASHPYDQLHAGLTSASIHADGLAGSSSTYVFDSSVAVHRDRSRELKRGTKGTAGPVIYWMSRDQRVLDNWALLHAQAVAKKSGQPLIVVFNLMPSFAGAPVRAFGFMLRGLRLVESDLQQLGISFRLLLGEPSNCVAGYANTIGASHVVVDYSPLRIGRVWREQVASRLDEQCYLQEVDAHNIVPVWKASPKLEVGARTIRKKLHTKLYEFCTAFPAPAIHAHALDTSLESAIPVYCTSSSSSSAAASSSSSGGRATAADVRIAARIGAGASGAGASSSSSSSSSSAGAGLTDWGSVLSHLRIDFSIPEVTWAAPGEREAREACDKFLTSRLKIYDDKRNDPTMPNAQSNLSPWIHFGHISAQRIVLEVMRITGSRLTSLFVDNRTTPAQAFCEELVIRKEVADNFCHYQPNYDKITGASAWAQETLRVHSTDKRPAVYTQQQFEDGKTHEQLWNACQMEMVHRGKLHGWARMYWCKKILEWSSSPEEALRIALYLNDKYNLDGRDPNGYVGCMWSIAGVHDMGWTERAIFGKIRFMNFEGAKRKFDVARYIAQHPVRKLPASPPPAAAGSEWILAASASGAAGR